MTIRSQSSTAYAHHNGQVSSTKDGSAARYFPIIRLYASAAPAGLIHPDKASSGRQKSASPPSDSSVLTNALPNCALVSRPLTLGGRILDIARRNTYLV